MACNLIDLDSEDYQVCGICCMYCSECVRSLCVNVCVCCVLCVCVCVCVCVTSHCRHLSSYVPEYSPSVSVLEPFAKSFPGF